MRRRGLVLALILVLVLLVALGGESLVWLLAARQVQTAFHQWIAARRSEGWQVASGAEQLAGWPFAALVEVAGFTISGGNKLLPGGLSWRTERLQLRLPLAAPDRLMIIPAGFQRLQLFGGAPIEVSADHISAAVYFSVAPLVYDSGGNNGVLLTATGVRMGPASFAFDLVRADRVKIDATPGMPSAGEVAASPTLRLEATGVSVGHDAVAALGGKIDIFSFTSALIHDVPSGTNWPSRLAAWRDHGGMVAVRSLSLVWGPLAVGGSGRLTLDRNLQPAGQATARVVGYAATLDALAGAGRIGSSVATAAKALLTLLARPSSSGGPPEVDVPLTLENRTVTLGQIPLVKLPYVSWPAGS